MECKRSEKLLLLGCLGRYIDAQLVGRTFSYIQREVDKWTDTYPDEEGLMEFCRMFLELKESCIHEPEIRSNPTRRDDRKLGTE